MLRDKVAQCSVRHNLDLNCLESRDASGRWHPLLQSDLSQEDKEFIKTNFGNMTFYYE